MSISIAKVFGQCRSLPRLASQHSRHFAIRSVFAREVIDSRGNPTVEADVTTENGLFRASVPSGASTGIYEALELRDKDSNRYLGQGCLEACENVNSIINNGISGLNEVDQQLIDDKMVQELDGSQNEWGWAKERLGANAILAVSLAVARAGAAAYEVPLYRHLANLSGHNRSELVMPVPSFNVINGGSHAGNALAMQEFMILPTGASSFKEAMQIGCEVYQHLKHVIKETYGQDAINVGDEGGFAPNINDNEEGLNLIMRAIKRSGHTGKVKLGMDVAAAEFLVMKNKVPHYDLNFKEKPNDGSQVIDGQALSQLYKDFAEKFPLVSMEDPFDQDDWENYGLLTKDIGGKVQIVGDDLLVTNPRRIEEAIRKKTCNALLLKVNQIGSVSESIEANNMSKDAGWGVMMSHRSGETEDSFIADLAVGLCTGQIKTGAPCRSERTAKLNQLMRIEEALGKDCVYAGTLFREP